MVLYLALARLLSFIFLISVSLLLLTELPQLSLLSAQPAFILGLERTHPHLQLLSLLLQFLILFR